MGWLLLRRWPLPFTSTEDGGCFLDCDQKKVQDSRGYDFHRLNLAEGIRVVVKACDQLNQDRE